MSIRQNIAFGLEVRQKLPPRAEIRWREVNEVALIQVQLSGYSPMRLSVAALGRPIAAAGRPGEVSVRLASKPNGDAARRAVRRPLDSEGYREELRTWLRRLHDEVHVTSLFVTHDQQEAFEVSDQIVVLNHGKRRADGAAADALTSTLATPFVTEFLGSVNVLPKLRDGHDGWIRRRPRDQPPAGRCRAAIRRHRSSTSRLARPRRSPGWGSTADPPGLRDDRPSSRRARAARWFDSKWLSTTALSLARPAHPRTPPRTRPGRGESVFVTPKDMKVFREESRSSKITW